MALSRLHLAYGLMSFCQAVLHNLFLVYHVEIFVSVYKISQSAFWLGEVIFLLWNSLNDPLFGWLSDSSSLHSKAKSSDSGDAVTRRIRAIRRCGPLYAASFLLLWFAWPWPGLQFVVCLCLYDGFLTVIDLHHTALLADMAVTLPDRSRLEVASSIFNAIGTFSLFASYFVWDRSHLASFQLVCFTLGVASALGFTLSSYVMHHECSKLTLASSKKTDSSNSSIQSQAIAPPSGSWSSWSSLRLYAKQVYRHNNFKWFTSMNLLQVFHCHFNSNFFPLFLEHLLGDSVSPFVSASLLSISFVLPHMNNLFFLYLCRRFGVYHVVKVLFLVKVILAFVMALVGPQSFVVLCVFIMSNRVFTEGTCKLLNLVVSDLVDEDFVIHGRQEPISALTFGTSALLCKPGQSLAPIVGMWLLTRLTGHSLFAEQSESAFVASTSGTVAASHSRLAMSWSGIAQLDMQSACFTLLVAVPLVCGLLQYLLWTQFTLHGVRLSNVKRYRMMHDSSGSSSKEPV